MNCTVVWRSLEKLERVKSNVGGYRPYILSVKLFRSLYFPIIFHSGEICNLAWLCFHVNIMSVNTTSRKKYQLLLLAVCVYLGAVFDGGSWRSNRCANIRLCPCDLLSALTRTCSAISSLIICPGTCFLLRPARLLSHTSPELLR